MHVKRATITPTERYIAANPDVVLSEIFTADFTKLSAINTCPVLGIIRYTHHKTMYGSGGRAMALEAGAAAHEVFAAHRLYAFAEFASEFYQTTDRVNMQTAFEQNGVRMFGLDRFHEMCNAVDSGEDYRTRCQQFALTALYNSGFYDDPMDRRRTTTNIEECCIAYMDKYTWEDQLPYWNGGTYLGIEQAVDVIVELEYEHPYTGTPELVAVRFTGKADGLHYIDRTRTRLRIHENKTASRLGDAWSMSFETSHQPTGYMLAMSAMYEMQLSEALILGVCLPLPKNHAITGLERIVVRREQHHFDAWCEWLLHTYLIHEQFKDAPLAAPQYTKSCNNYFRPCEFIPFCASDNDTRKDMLADMEVAEWSPLHSVADKAGD